MSESVRASQLEEIERPTGPVAAAVLATGIGAFVLGLLTTLNEASTGVHDFLEFDEDVGPLSGKTIIAVIAYLGSWAVGARAAGLRGAERVRAAGEPRVQRRLPAEAAPRGPGRRPRRRARPP